MSHLSNITACRPWMNLLNPFTIICSSFFLATLLSSSAPSTLSASFSFHSLGVSCPSNHHPATHPSIQPSCSLEDKQFPFFQRRKSSGQKGSESAQAGHETSSQPSRPPRPKPLNSQAPSSGHFPVLWIFVQVKISKEPAATKHSITFK